MSLNGYAYVQNDENFRGRPLSSWLVEWVQWAHSASVTYNGRFGEILLTRGNLSYQGSYPNGSRTQVNADKPYEETVYITNDVPVYINVRTAFYFLNEPHPFGSMNTICDVLAACRDDHSHSYTEKANITKLIDQKNIDAKINDKKITKLKTCDRIEAVGFQVKVDPRSQLADQFEFPVEKGTDLVGCAVAEICLLKSLSAGKYVIDTSNVGARGYKSASRYIVNVGNARAVSSF